MKQIKTFFFPFFIGITYFFLYIPIAVLVLFSFSGAELSYHWDGFSLRWYEELFQQVDVFLALKNSLTVALASVMLSLVMGVLFVFYSSRLGLDRYSKFFYGNLGAPEIVLAVGLLSLFSFFSVPLGLTTLIAGHTVIGLGYVVPIVHARFSELDVNLTEASFDLGASEGQTFFKVILPMLTPSLCAASLLVFIISLDDFVISFFCSGASTQTLPMYIFSMIRSGASPMVNALSTLLLVASSLLVMVFSALQVKRMF